MAPAGYGMGGIGKKLTQRRIVIPGQCRNTVYDERVEAGCAAGGGLEMMALARGSGRRAKRTSTRSRAPMGQVECAQPVGGQ